MTRTLSANLYHAAKTAYIPASKMSKAAKTLPILHRARIFTHDGNIVMQCIDSSGETWELLAESAPARVDQEFDTCIPMKAFRDWLSVTAKYKSVLSLQYDETTKTLTATEEQDGIKTRARFYCLPACEFPSNLPVKVN